MVQARDLSATPVDVQRISPTAVATPAKPSRAPWLPPRQQTYSTADRIPEPRLPLSAHFPSTNPSMAIVEDPASVLEHFVHDVANLPAEITHLYEEMQAKDAQIQECRSIINARDSSIQKFIKLNSSMVKNPKEDGYAKVILQNYERAQLLQEEKIALSEKAAALVSSL